MNPDWSADGYDGFRSAGTRLGEPQLEHLRSHRTELLGDSLPAIHAFDKAHLVMLTETGLVPAEDGVAMLRAIRRMEADGVAEVRIAAQGGMHSGEQYLIGELGVAVGGRIHLGRSSGDLIEVARRLTIRTHVHALLDALAGARSALLALAEAHAGTVMPGYTHGQHAQPTTLAHWATMFEQAFARDTARLLDLHPRLNRSPAGAAILTGSDFALDRQRVSDLLGFDEPLPHTMDAILSHDLEMEVAGLLATVTGTLARLADDLFLWSTSEFAFVDLPDRYCGTSSIMPQKKNPDVLEDIKSVASQALAGLVAVVTAERGPTGFPILERRHSQDVIWGMLGATTAKLVDTTGVLADLRPDVDRMAAAAGAHWAQATDLASALVRDGGLDWRSAHQVVATFVRRSIERGESPSTASLTLLEEVVGGHTGLSESALRDALNAVAFVERRTLLGGPAPSAVRREMAAFADRLAQDRVAADGLRAHAARAAGELEMAIDRLLDTAG